MSTRHLYRYVWGSTTEQQRFKGRLCERLDSQIVTRVRFLDTGEEVTVSKQALRRYEGCLPPTGRGSHG